MDNNHMMSVAGSNIGLGPLPFNLHIKDGSGRVVLYGRQGVVITPELRESIQRTERQFFISIDDLDSYLDYTLGNVEQIVRKPGLNVAAKSDILKDAGRKIFTKIATDRMDSRTIGYSQKFTGSVVDLILGSPDAYESLLSMSDKKTYLFDHALNTCTFCIMIGMNVLKADDVTLYLLGLGGLLHDIGMVSIGPEILEKSGPLTREEHMRVQAHPRHGFEMLRRHNLPPEVLSMVRDHHECHDGSGYPAGLSRNNISQFAAIASVADVYDALTSDRSYRAAMQPVDAIKEMLHQRQKFSPKMLEALMLIVLRSEDLVSTLLARTA